MISPLKETISELPLSWNVIMKIVSKLKPWAESICKTYVLLDPWLLLNVQVVVVVKNAFSSRCEIHKAFRTMLPNYFTAVNFIPEFGSSRYDYIFPYWLFLNQEYMIPILWRLYWLPANFYLQINMLVLIYSAHVVCFLATFPFSSSFGDHTDSKTGKEMQDPLISGCWLVFI